MKPPRSALPLPRYVLRKRLKSSCAFFFNVPMWARKAGSQIGNEPLSTDYAKAVERAETVLLPAFDSWRGGGKSSEDAPAIAAPGTLDWVFAEYRADRRFTKLDARTKRNHDVGFRMGKSIERERRTTVNRAMKSCRRAWKIAARHNPGKVPHVNPFANMGLQSSDRATPTATYEELQTFRTKAKKLGLHSLATAALIGWEWLQREVDIFATFEVTHYRSKEHPNAVRVVHEKTGEENWIPLFDEKTGAPFYAELMAELDAIKKKRIAGLMLRRDWGQHAPWPTWPKEDEVDLTHMSRKTKEVIRAAGLRDELTFTSFRHGRFTEAGDSELTDRELMAQGRHKSPKVLGKYVKPTMRQVAAGTRKRLAARTNGGQLSE